MNSWAVILSDSSLARSVRTLASRLAHEQDTQEGMSHERIELAAALGPVPRLPARGGSPVREHGATPALASRPGRRPPDQSLRFRRELHADLPVAGGWSR